MFLSRVLLVATAVAWGCQTEDSKLDVVGGTEDTANKYPSVVLLTVDQNPNKICTGVAVAPDTLLMAGHCVKDPTLEKGVGLAGTTIKSKRIFTWLALKNADLLDVRSAARDLAVVVMEAAAFRPPFPAVSFEQAQVGAPLTVVGYGASTFDVSTVEGRASSGKRRSGTNTITKIDADLITLEARVGEVGPTRAMAAPGDSGGPLFDQYGRVIGIGAGLKLLNAAGQATPIAKDQYGIPTPSLNGAVTAVNVYVNLASENSRKLLAHAARNGASIPALTVRHDVPLNLNDNSWMLPANDKGRGEYVAMCGGGGGGGDDAFLGSGGGGFPGNGNNGLGGNALGGNGFGGNGFGGLAGNGSAGGIPTSTLSPTPTPTPTPKPTPAGAGSSQFGGPRAGDIRPGGGGGGW